MQINILGGEDAKDELDIISETNYHVKPDYRHTGGYYQQKNKAWISWSVAGDEVFVEDFKEKSDAIFYAMGIPVELSDGTYK